MKSTTIIIAIAAIISIGGLVWFARPTGNKADISASSAEGSLKSDATLFDFGTISMANGKVTHDFTIANASGQPVAIGKMYTSCMCTSALLKIGGDTFGPFGMEGMGGNLYLTQTLNPGEKATVEAIYDPAAHGPAGVGAIDRFIYVEDKSGNRLAQFEIKANVTP